MSNLQHLSIWERIGLGLALIFCRTLSGILFFVLSKIWHYRRKVVFDNLAASFPELSADQIKQTAHSYFRHLADLIAESLLIAHLTDRQLRALTRFENINLIQKLLREQKSIVLVASHVGNWEYLHLLPALTGCEVFAAYSPVTNQWIDKAFMQMRSRFGVQLIAKRDWYRFVLQRREKQPAIFITIADQRPEKPGEHCIHFLNQKTFFQPGAARLASKLDCALVYLDVSQTARNAYN
ncbi:lysophospholipid acyltransferase family protein, partial [Dyadobacter sp.]|uniref:lysophospholipid acyltransferase family protein n=1 Tax=Dyadobacter sp. TaxID=1914288 RepID=UPI003F70E087